MRENFVKILKEVLSEKYLKKPYEYITKVLMSFGKMLAEFWEKKSEQDQKIKIRGNVRKIV